MFNRKLKERIDFLEKDLEFFKFRYRQDNTVWEFDVLDELVLNADDDKCFLGIYNTDRVTVMYKIPRVNVWSENRYRIAINKNEQVFAVDKYELEKYFTLKE